MSEEIKKLFSKQTKVKKQLLWRTKICAAKEGQANCVVNFLACPKRQKRISLNGKLNFCNICIKYYNWLDYLKTRKDSTGDLV